MKGGNGMIYAACSLALIAAGTDLWSRRIPNLLVLAGLFAGIFLGVMTGGVNGLVVSLIGAAAGFSLLLLPYLMGGMGGGDVKLMMALGAIMGPVAVFWIFVFACLVGGIMALGALITSGRWRVLAADWLLPLGIAITYPSYTVPKIVTIPYGVAIAAGVLIYIVQGVI